MLTPTSSRENTVGRLDLGRFKKLYAAIASAVIMAAYGFYDDQILTGNEKIQIVSAAVAAFLVWITANGPEGTFWRYAKAAAYGATAVLATLLTTAPGGVHGREWIALAISFGTGAGILSLRNNPEPPREEAPEEVIVH